MAGTLLHVTLADAALSRGRDEIASLVTPHIEDYHLGAVAFDLPYFEHLLYRAFQLFVTRELGYGTWGYLFHLRSPSDFCRILLENADSPSAKAYALGALTHLAVDLTYHPFIEARIMMTADGAQDLNRMHKIIEDELDIVAHSKVLGHSAIGTDYAAAMLDLAPSFSYTALFSVAATAIHGVSPSRESFERWRKSLRLFGRLHRSGKFPWVRVKHRGSRALRQAGESLAEQAIERTVQYLEAGMAFLEKSIDGTQFADRVPNRNLINGKEAEGERSPGRFDEDAIRSSAE